MMALKIEKKPPGTPAAIPSAPAVDPLELLDRDELIQAVRAMQGNGVALSFSGKRAAMEIAKRVRPRVTRRITELHVGSAEEQSRNTLIEGENLQALATLYQHRGQVDLIVTDPPYNTGNDFRYNDRWDSDPNDPDLGPLVSLEDGARHTKWMRFMWPRLQMMKAMLKPSGVLAICIDHRELFRLGTMLDEIFTEENRIAIINWQKNYAPKNNVGKRAHVSTATEYTLVYANNIDVAKTRLLDRTERMNARYESIDGDPEPWSPGDLSGPGADTHAGQVYAIQSPFSGDMMYPPDGRCWAAERARVKSMLEAWGSTYVSKDLKDGKAPALAIQGSLATAKKKAEAILKKGTWPVGYWRDGGYGAFRLKKYLKDVRRGVIPMTYWADEEYDSPEILGATSWNHEESGHSQTGVNELNAIVGRGHSFETVKPLKLFSKIIQIWCPPKGLVLDPFAGSGTTGHAVLSMNAASGSERRFILVEQGRPERGDSYARSLTADRLRRVIEGDWANQKGTPLGGGFEFRALTRQIDAKAVLSMKKDELIDVVITSHWEMGRRNSPTLIRLDDPKFTYLVGRNEQGEGYFIIWNNGGPVGQLDRDSYRIVLKDAEKAGLKPPFHVYARYEVYQSRNVQFWKIPDKILAHLGLNENSDPFNDDEARA
ncbi:site-specific DNA-methyltransferase [Methylosinus sp. Sm6]|uniref:site-specific DNA-methyltransferase n=1 Tax=Methylosinus sp. Sm6 TaxID=2866948 RepID=UPI0021029002|nr:site-specific DNA-methyltransferase [Methylosinus sp. Sm6]